MTMVVVFFSDCFLNVMILILSNIQILVQENSKLFFGQTLALVFCHKTFCHMNYER